MKFWVLDLGVFHPSDWHTDAEEREGRSAQDVAENFAAMVDEDCCDGASFEVLVAEDKAGTTARRYRVRCNVSVTYDVKKSEDCKIPPPGGDA